MLAAGDSAVIAVASSPFDEHAAADSATATTTTTRLSTCMRLGAKPGDPMALHGAGRSLRVVRMGPHTMMPRDVDAVKGTKLARETGRRVWGFARPYRGTIVLFLALILIAALLALVPPLVVGPILDTAIPAGDRARSACWRGSRSRPRSVTPSCRSCSGGAAPASARG